MQVLKKITFDLAGKERQALFGVPVTKMEKEKMFRLRYRVYNNHGYIDGSSFPDNLEKDKYDLEGKCYYFIAKVGEDVVGSVRLITDEYLPTEKDSFDFKEPRVMVGIDRDKRAEISRLVARKYKVSGYHLPRHLVLFGLLLNIVNFAEEKGIKGGYAFVKKSLDDKLRKLRVPIHHIKEYEEVYSGGVLEKYFEQKNNPVFPVYYLLDEVKDYLRIACRTLFSKKDKNEIKYKGSSWFRLLIASFLLKLNS